MLLSGIPKAANPPKYRVDQSSDTLHWGTYCVVALILLAWYECTYVREESVSSNQFNKYIHCLRVSYFAYSVSFASFS